MRDLGVMRAGAVDIARREMGARREERRVRSIGAGGRERERERGGG